MRNAVAAIVLALIASVGALAASPTVTRAATGPKVVIIVGATHGATAGYRADADQVYAEAIKHTPNVYKVYSPNATWARVKAVTVGASIVVYLGHGNGWPSPYSYDPKFTTKDGFGLNATAGAGDYNNKYYGEPSVATLDLAPNAVIILSHLCYASGNSEPGNAAPTQFVARQRVDNYGAGFLKGKARAVIADGHGEAGPYIRALFTSHATIEQVWRSVPDYHGHTRSFASTRTPGATAYTDTDTTTSGYYRSLVTRPGLTSDDVTGLIDTSTDPSSFVVPGNAEVSTAGGAALYPDASLTPHGAADPAAPTLAAGTRLRLVASGASTTDVGTPSVQVEGIDDASISGFMALADLRPRDSRAPLIWSLDTGLGAVSPNGDTRYDAVRISARFSESVDWRLRILDGESTVWTRAGNGTNMSADWDGTSMDGPVLADGTYAYAIDATDGWHNGPTTRTGTISVDTIAGALAAVTPADDVPAGFTPNGDGSRDVATWTATTTEAGRVGIRIVDGTGATVRTLSAAAGVGPVAVSWDGKDATGQPAPDGMYEARIYPRDRVGNIGPTVTRAIRVSTTLGWVTSSKTLFYPQDGDGLAGATLLGFRLARPAVVSLTIRDATGATVRTIIDNESRAAGSWTAMFDGRADDGTFLPTGLYRGVAIATDDLTTVSQAVAFQMAAFSIKASDSTPGRGQRLTVSATSAEALSAAPRLIITQPGLAAWSVAMTRVSTYGYRATVTLRTGGRAGLVSFTVRGVDKYLQVQRTTRAYPLH